jgi:hypothetical protein
LIKINPIIIESLIVGGVALISTFSPFTATPVYAETVPVVEEIDYVACNCYQFIQKKIENLPRTAELVGNSIYPHVGGVIILYYKNLVHYVFVEEVLKDGVRIAESNYTHCEYSKRFLTWEYLESHQAKYWYQDI